MIRIGPDEQAQDDRDGRDEELAPERAAAAEERGRVDVHPRRAGVRRLGHAGTSALAGCHDQADRDPSRQSLGVDDRHELAAVDDPDPVGQLEDLVELGRHEQHGRARVALGDDLLVDELDRADVDAAGRLVGDEQD